MRELYIRGISGLFYVGLILGSVFYDLLLYTLVILIFSALAMIEFQRLVAHKSYMPVALVVLLVYNFYQSKIVPIIELKIGRLSHQQSYPEIDRAGVKT